MSGGNAQQPASGDKYAESMMNLMLLDPPRWGWTAMGGVADLLPPHERARRKTTKRAFLKSKKRQREKAATGTAAASASNNVPTSVPDPAKVNNTSTAVASSNPEATNAETQQAPAATETAASSDPPKNSDETNEVNSDKKEVPSTDDAGKIDDNGEPTATTTDKPPPEEETAAPEKNGDNDKPTAEEATATKSQTNGDAALEIAESTTVEEPKTDKASEEPVVSESEPPNATSATNEAAAQKTAVEAKVESAPTEKTEEAMESAASAKPQNVEEQGAAPPAPSGTTSDAQQETTTSNIMNTDGSDANNPKELVIKTLRDDGSIDIYAYHRGREGMEPRDEATGELLCDVPQTDTNYKWDEPRLSLQVNVSFPLCDEDVVNSSDIPRFEDTIHWDLANPETPTPMAFAAKTAEEFGLSFGQTIDLATSIEVQIFRHMQDNCGYSVPVALSDGAGTERTNYPIPKIAQMYGGVFVRDAVQSGTDLKNVVSAAPRSKQKGSNRASSVATHGSNTRRNPSSAKAVASLPTYFNEAVDEKFLEEARKRMIQYSREDCQAHAAQTGSKPGLLKMRLNYVCHICHKRHDLVGQFGCPNVSHSYCVNHLQARLGLTVRAVTDKVVCDHCPICSVSCKCAKCARRLDALAIELKRRSDQQGGTDPANTVFDEMFSTLTKPRASESLFKDVVAANKRRESISSKTSDGPKLKTAPSVERPKSQTKAKSTPKGFPARKSEELLRIAGPIAKARPTDFPREIRGGEDMDPGTTIDYYTVYSAAGKYVKELDFSKLVTPTKPDDVTVVEDGNVDYCHTCRKHGNLVCCDFCPRAFHLDCLGNDGGSDDSRMRWECHVCKHEKEELPEYTLTGLESQALICAAYSDIKTTSDNDLTQLSVLSKMHEMAQKLMNGDFGPLFAAPVDSRMVPDYPAVIKKPMDLGTIGSKLVDGTYRKFFDANQSWDDVHLAVLKDFELVWHNCLLYNVEGSSIYRMAQVLRRRMLAMRTRSLDHELSTSVKEKVEEYVKTKEKERGKIPKVLDDRPRSRHKINLGAKKAGNATNVAILDPDTGMVVKIYSTVSAAVKAAEYMKGCNLQSGLVHMTINSIKSVIKKGAEDPSLTMFGYRWVEFELLRNDQVLFAETDHSMYEMIDGESTSIFMSLDEALSDPRLPKDISLPQLKKALIELPKGGETSVAGKKWKRHESDGRGILMSSLWKEGRAVTPSISSSSSLLSDSAVVKEDVVLRRTLGGYETLDAAFEDWVLMCKDSPLVPGEEITRPNFQNYYLDGDRNVDGIVWKTVERPDSQSTDGMQVEVAEPNKPEKQGGTVVSADNDPSTAAITVCDGQDPPIAQSQVDSAVENIPTQIGTAGDVSKDKLPAEPVSAPNNTKKRERSEEEVLQPRKK